MVPELMTTLAGMQTAIQQTTGSVVPLIENMPASLVGDEVKTLANTLQDVDTMVTNIDAILSSTVSQVSDGKSRHFSYITCHNGC